jgi:hypothetical protein
MRDRFLEYAVRRLCLTFAAAVSLGAYACGRAPEPAQTVQSSTDVDPSNIPLAQLAAIRGAMWTARLNLPFGPRPHRDDNVIATDFITAYSPADRLRIVEALKARGYTHVVMGPLVDSDGYHGLWPARDWRGAAFAEFLDAVQFFWNHGLAPVVFIHPDNWSFEQTRRELTPLLSQPRAQRLLRIIVPSGWEPTKDGWSSCTWANFAKWGGEVLPHALILIHTVTDVEAPVGTDALCDDKGHSPAEGWARVAPFVHGWLVQNGGYFSPIRQRQDPAWAAQYAAFKASFPAQFDIHTNGSLMQRFENGSDGWPRGSKWGPGTRIRLYAGEYAAYPNTWFNWPEEEGRSLGDMAMAAGADGYLDGGHVPVPVRK